MVVGFLGFSEADLGLRISIFWLGISIRQAIEIVGKQLSEEPRMGSTSYTAAEKLRLLLGLFASNSLFLHRFTRRLHAEN